MKKVTVELNEREEKVLERISNENNEIDFFASLETLEGAPEHFVDKVIYFFGSLFIVTIYLVLMILYIALLYHFPMLWFYLLCISIVLKLIDK